eukprot:1146574-Pelagomonas_calceolata.AAC.4
MKTHALTFHAAAPARAPALRAGHARPHPARGQRCCLCGLSLPSPPALTPAGETCEGAFFTSQPKGSAAAFVVCPYTIASSSDACSQRAPVLPLWPVPIPLPAAQGLCALRQQRVVMPDKHACWAACTTSAPAACLSSQNGQP